MITWILILWAQSNFITQEFNTKEKCENAGTTAVDKFSSLLTKPLYVCVEK